MSSSKYEYTIDMPVPIFERQMRERALAAGILVQCEKGKLFIMKLVSIGTRTHFRGQPGFIGEYEEQAGKTVVRGRIGSPRSFYVLAAVPFVLIASLYLYICATDGDGPGELLLRMWLILLFAGLLLLLDRFVCSVVFYKPNRASLSLLEAMAEK